MAQSASTNGFAVSLPTFETARCWRMKSAAQGPTWCFIWLRSRSFAEPSSTLSIRMRPTSWAQAARGTSSVRTVVVVTSDKVYENVENANAFAEGDRLGGREPYGTSKAACELVIDAYRKSYLDAAGIGIASVRAGNIIGGGDWTQDRLIPDAVRAIAAGRKMLVRNPTSVRPWQHVVDAVSGTLLVAESLARGPVAGAGPWNLGPDPSNVWPVSRVVERFATLWGDGASWEPASDAEPQPYQARILTLDSRRARSELGWRPSLSLEEALLSTVAWYKAHERGLNVAKLSQKLVHSISDT